MRLLLQILISCVLTTTLCHATPNCREIVWKKLARLQQSKGDERKASPAVSAVLSRVEGRIGLLRTKKLSDFIQTEVDYFLKTRLDIYSLPIREALSLHLVIFSERRILFPTAGFLEMSNEVAQQGALADLRRLEMKVADFLGAKPSEEGAGLLELKPIESIETGVFAPTETAVKLVKLVQETANAVIISINKSNMSRSLPKLNPEQENKILQNFALGLGIQSVDVDLFNEGSLPVELKNQALPLSIRQLIVTDHHAEHYNPNEPLQNTTGLLIKELNEGLKTYGPIFLRSFLMDHQFLITDNLGDGSPAIYVVQNAVVFSDNYLSVQILKKARDIASTKNKTLDQKVSELVRWIHERYNGNCCDRDLGNLSSTTWISNHLPIVIQAFERGGMIKTLFSEESLVFPEIQKKVERAWKQSAEDSSDLDLIKAATQYEDFDVFGGKGFSEPELSSSVELGQAWLRIYGKALKNQKSLLGSSGIPANDRFGSLSSEDQIELMTGVQAELDRVFFDLPYRQKLAAEFRADVNMGADTVIASRISMGEKLDKEILVYDGDRVTLASGPFEPWAAPSLAKKKLGLESQLSFVNLGNGRTQIVFTGKTPEIAEEFKTELTNLHEAKAKELALSGKDIAVVSGRGNLVFIFSPGTPVSREDVLKIIARMSR